MIERSVLSDTTGWINRSTEWADSSWAPAHAGGCIAPPHQAFSAAEFVL